MTLVRDTSLFSRSFCLKLELCCVALSQECSSSAFFVANELLFFLFFKKAAWDEMAETMLSGVKVPRFKSGTIFF